MKRAISSLSAIGLLLGCSLLTTRAAQAVPDTPAAVPAATDLERAATLRVPFVENLGQHDARVAYAAGTFGGKVFVTRDGRLVHSFPGSGQPGGWTLVETLVDAAALAPRARDPARVSVNRFSGREPSRWSRQLPAWNRVELGRAWDGIDVAVQAHGNNVEKLFTVGPGADASRIRVSVDGAQSLRLGADGSLVAATGQGDIAFTAPVAFQELAGGRRAVAVAYALDGTRYGFELGAHDPAHAVVIDPVLQSTQAGGGSNDHAYKMAISPLTGDVYLAGYATSGDFPGTTGGPQPGTAGGFDGAVVRFNASLTALLGATYLGGSGTDIAIAIGIHPQNGDVYVVGESRSGNFPTTGGSVQPGHGGGGDFTVSRLDPALSTLLASTYLGGTGTESGTAVAFEPASGDVYVAGYGGSTDFPGTSGGAQEANGGNDDDLIARLDASLSTLVQATYVGGSGWESLFNIAVHPQSGDLYFAGYTDGTDFPATAGGAQAVAGGENDFTVARLDGALTHVIQSTFLGTDARDLGYGIAVHPASGDIYVSGHTASTPLPGAAGGAQPNGLGSDIGLARFSADLTVLKQATHLGGTGIESAASLIVHPLTGEVYVGAYTTSTNFPGTAEGAQPASAGGSEMAVARLDPGLTTLLQATYVGGSGDDVGQAVVLHPLSGEVYVAGGSASPNLNGAAGGAQPWHGGNDFAVARLAASLADVDTTPDAFSFTDQTGVPRGVLRESDAVAVGGIDAPAAVTVAGGEYSVNGGAFTAAAGTVSPGDSVRVRHTTAAGFSGATATTLSIDAVSDTWTTVTEVEDLVPDAFAFADETGVPRSTLQMSNAVVIAGVNSSAPVAVSGGEYSVNGGAWTAGAGSVGHGDAVRVRHITAAGFGAATHTTLTVGGVSDTWTTATLGADTTPDAFNFRDRWLALPLLSYRSNVVTITGINTTAPISISAGPFGRYRINGGNWTAAQGTVQPGDEVQVEDSFGLDVFGTTMTITVGGVTDTRTVSLLP